jgi:Protein of unknown function (DUF2884)
VTPRSRFELYAFLSATLFVTAGSPGLAAECEVQSQYDLTLSTGALLFERTKTQHQRIEMRGGRLTVNGVTVALGDSDRRRVMSYETKMRALISRVRTLAQRAVDLAAIALREEGERLSSGPAATAKLNATIDGRARELKSRIAKSTTTKEWHGAALNRYSAAIASEILSIVAGDLARQAVELASKGDLAGAAALQRRASSLGASLETRVRKRIEVLEPELSQLCRPARELDALESAVTARMPDGSRLDLLEIRR